jgi:hypothetical protein
MLFLTSVKSSGCRRNSSIGSKEFSDLRSHHYPKLVLPAILFQWQFDLLVQNGKCHNRTEMDASPSLHEYTIPCDRNMGAIYQRTIRLTVLVSKNQSNKIVAYVL